MLVAKFPGSMYAIEAMTAGPPKAIAVRSPPGPPASASVARPMVRPVSVDRSTAGSSTVGLAVKSCRIVSPGQSLAAALTPKCSTSYSISIALIWVNGSYCSQDYILTRQECYGPEEQDRISGVRSGMKLMGKLPAEGTQARRFGKTRSAQSSALHEDYVELIADLLEG
jgi:hypothetical protein